MKKLTALVLLLSFVFAGAAFAAEAKPAVKASTGTVVSVTATSLVVKVGAKEETFVLDAKTVFEGKDKKPFLPTALKAGEKVTVRFTAAEKVLTAVAVLLK
jgi:ribosomal protein S1